MDIRETYSPEWPKWVRENTIMLGICGSQAYGTATPTSDMDYRGVCFGPATSYLGLDSFEQAESKNPDATIYEIRKFFRLAINNNPNILELLFLPQDCLIKKTWEWNQILDNRYKFLSKRIKDTYGGYAYAQVKRMESHRSHILYPPEKKPDRKDFGLPETSLISSDILGTIKSADAKGILLEQSYSKEVLNIYFRERQYSNAQTEWKQYEDWKKNRNPERAELERKMGYDGKHAAHIVRLMRTGIEVLNGGELRVRRHDAKELLSIRNGAWTYDHLKGWFEDAQSELREAAEKSDLPEVPDYKYMNELCTEIVFALLGGC